MRLAILSALTLLALTGCKPSVPKSCLFALTFEKDAGTEVFRDTSGHQHDAKPTGAVQSIKDHWRGQVVHLAGNGAYLRVPASPETAPDGSFTLSVWIHPEYQKHASVVLEWPEAVTPQSATLLSTGTDAQKWSDGFNIYIDGGLSQHWHQFVITYDAKTRKATYYISGDKVREQILPENHPRPKGDLLIGGRPGENGWAFKGFLDDIELHNVVWTHGEIWEKATKGPGTDVFSPKPK